MPETYQAYHPWEVALQVADSVSWARVQCGDIVVVRPPGPAIGLKERATFLWLQIEGLDDSEMASLMTPLMENGVIVEKRRYSIPFWRLQEVWPAFDRVRAMNPVDIYQPFQIYDQEYGEKLVDNVAPLVVQGLVFDKATMRFL